MAKYKSYDYSQTVLLPVSLEEQLIPGTLEFTIHTLVERRMDTQALDERYRNDETGRKAYDPKILLKIVLLGYSRGIVSSRKLERACRENVLFMALSCWQQPDHSTIATFVSSMKDEITSLFQDILLVCDEMNLLGGTAFALDGCKLPSNASADWSGRRADFERKKAKLRERVTHLIEEQQVTDRKECKKASKGRFPGGGNKGEQIEKLERHAERIEKWLENYVPRTGTVGQELKQNITDDESAILVTSHGTYQGYNGQALVDSKQQVIVHAEAFGRGQDAEHVSPMIRGAKENMAKLGHGEDYFRNTVLTADAEYHSPANLKACDEEGLDAYIPDRRFRRRDPRLRVKRPTPKKKYTLEDFHFHEESDEYICPAGKRLRRIVKRARSGETYYRRYSADAEDCKRCVLRSRCLKHPTALNRSLGVPVGITSNNLSKRMAEKIDTERGRKIYYTRMGIAEPVFANIRTHKRLDRFTLRSKAKVNIQWVLYCMVHNIGKICNTGLAWTT